MKFLALIALAAAPFLVAADDTSSFTTTSTATVTMTMTLSSVGNGTATARPSSGTGLPGNMTTVRPTYTAPTNAPTSTPSPGAAPHIGASMFLAAVGGIVAFAL